MPAKTIPPGQTASFQFLLGWRFPNRTPDWCGWSAPPGEGKTVIGNFYSARFKSAWDAVAYTAANLESLEARTRMFAGAYAREHAARGCEGGRQRKSFHAWPPPPAFAPRMASFTALRAATTSAAAALATVLMFGITRRQLRFCFRRLPARCAAALLATRWTTPARSTSASCCRMARRAQDLPRRTARWGRSCMRGSTGRSAETMRCCAHPGRAQRRHSSLRGFPADGTATAMA